MAFFFGYADQTHGSTIQLKKARLCVYWTTDLRGFMGLASTGPGKGCRIGPAASGDGSGSASGDGVGSGYGSGSYWLSIGKKFAKKSSSAVSVVAFWKSNKDGSPANGGAGTVARVGLREKVNGPLRICTKNALHATTQPDKWKGEKLWVVALYGEYQQQGDKFGALEREIIGEVY